MENGRWFHRLRSDRNGFSSAQVVGALVGVLITVIIGFALVSTLLSSVDSVNDTTAYPTGSAIPGLVNLAPLLFILGVVIATIAVIFVALRAGMGGGD